MDHILADCTQPIKYKRNILTFESSLLKSSNPHTSIRRVDHGRVVFTLPILY